MACYFNLTSEKGARTLKFRVRGCGDDKTISLQERPLKIGSFHRDLATQGIKYRYRPNLVFFWKRIVDENVPSRYGAAAFPGHFVCCEYLSTWEALIFPEISPALTSVPCRYGKGSHRRREKRSRWASPREHCCTVSHSAASTSFRADFDFSTRHIHNS
jgi:hypothetical protein